MAIAHIKLTHKSMLDLSHRAAAAGQVRLARELERASKRDGLTAELRSSEVRILKQEPLLPDQAAEISRALEAIERAEAYERDRDARVQPKLEARRRQMYELNERSSSRGI
jgi:predicted  nucleic acid-binding Zn-ribbon protein